MNPLTSYNNIFFIGIGGIGMSALARYFMATGKNVSGYDKTATKLTNALQQEHISITFEDEPNAVDDLQSDDTLVVYTPAIKNLRLLDYFRDNGFTVLKRAQVLGMITEATQCVAVAGTHGKTTTSSLVAHLCKEADLPFSAFLGGIAENYGSNFIYNGNDISVVEADEFDRSFLNLKPTVACITSTDADHLDIYGDSASIEKSFRDFASLVPEDQDLYIRKGINVGRQARMYAVDEPADFWSDNIRMIDDKTYFDFHAGDEVVTDFVWDIPGVHNVENATVAIAMVKSLGADYAALKTGIATFKGIKRRFTKHRFGSGKIYIDDYAHHPTELDAAIGSIRKFYPGKKLLVVFQPHLFSRTRDFADDFARSLSQGDELLLLDIYPARELPIEGVTSEWLCEKVTTAHRAVCSLQGALALIKEKEFEILLTVGAGNIDTLYDPIVEWLSREDNAL